MISNVQDHKKLEQIVENWPVETEQVFKLDPVSILCVYVFNREVLRNTGIYTATVSQSGTRCQSLCQLLSEIWPLLLSPSYLQPEL